MAKKRRFNELIKDFSRIRSYMRDFYVRGFLTRENFDGEKSLGTYDDEKRRIKSYLSDWMESGSSKSKKTNYISIDSRLGEHSPLFRAWKSKSFTDKDISLHFILLDILHGGNFVSFPEILEKINDQYSDGFKSPFSFDEKTVRLKLKELEDEGILKSEKRGRAVFYALEKSFDFEKWAENEKFVAALNFFTEVLPCGVVGSFLLEKLPLGKRTLPFSFSRHYILQTLDSEIEYKIFEAIRNECFIKIKYLSRKAVKIKNVNCLPLKVFHSVENGRSYLIGSESRRRNIACIRIDRIQEITECGKCEDVTERNEIFNDMKKHVWGVSFPNKKEVDENGINTAKPFRIEFTVKFGDDEEFVWERLIKEKRCGIVERLDKNNAKFTCELYTPCEIKPWIRTFTSWITGFDLGSAGINEDFKNGIEKMYEMYGV